MRPREYRLLLAVLLAAIALAAGQSFSYLSALEGHGLAGVWVTMLLFALPALALVAAVGEGPTPRNLGAALAGAAVVWGVPQLVGPTLWVTGGFGLNFAAAAGVGAAVALGPYPPLRLALRFAAIAPTLVLLYAVRDDLPDSGDWLRPAAVVLAVGIVEVASRLGARGQIASAAAVLAIPVAALLASAELEDREREQLRREQIRASTPPPARVGRERIVWVAPVGELNGPPLLAGDVVLVDAVDGFRALDAATGRTRWRARIPGRDGLAEPSVRDDLVLYPANLAGLFALDLETGEQQWREQSDDTQFGAAVGHGDVVVALRFGPTGLELSGHNARTGEETWVTPVAGDRFGLTADTKGVVLRADERRSRVDLASGRLDSAAATPLEPYSYGPRSALRSRRHGWKFRASWEAATSQPVEAAGVVYVNIALPEPKANGGLYALDARTGRLRWRVELAGDAFGRPAVGPKLIYVRGVNGVYAIRR